MKQILTLAAIVAVALTAAFAATPIVNKSNRTALDNLSWLLGSWRLTGAKDVTFETWQRPDSTSFVGNGVTLAGADTVFSEKLSLLATDSGLFYVAEVAHNPAPTYFKMIRQDSVTTVFENPAHDFPTRIIYARISADSLHARIEGLRQGKPAGVDFLYERAK